MSTFPFITLFTSTLILGSTLALSGSHWIFMWMGLELNLMSFVPLLTSSQTNQEAEAAMKYFMAQALGSGLLLMSSLTVMSNNFFFLSNTYSLLLLLTSLLVKLGLPPCHFWFPSVMSTISWPLCMILSTWQKLVPLLLLLYSFNLNIMLISFLVIMFASFVGGIGGLNQTQLRPLLAYSSIGHMSWMLGASLISLTTGLLYFLIYIIITMPIMLLFWTSSTSLLNFSSSLNWGHNGLLLVLIPSIFSLGGIPPFTGFIPKWMVMELVSPLSPSIVLVLLIGSMINLSYYFNLAFISVLKSKSAVPFKPMINKGLPISITMLSVYSLGLAPFFFLCIYALTIFY